RGSAASAAFNCRLLRRSLLRCYGDGEKWRASMRNCAVSRSVERRILIVTFAIAACLATASLAQDVLPRPEPQFKGKIGRTAKVSTPDFPKAVEAPKGAP